MISTVRARRSRSDYPKGVLAIYDNGGKTADRYTVCYTPYDLTSGKWYPYVAMSGAPHHPQGVCQHGELQWRPVGYGKVIAFDALPEECRNIVLSDIQGWEA